MKKNKKEKKETEAQQERDNAGEMEEKSPENENNNMDSAEGAPVENERPESESRTLDEAESEGRAASENINPDSGNSENPDETAGDRKQKKKKPFYKKWWFWLLVIIVIIIIICIIAGNTGKDKETHIYDDAQAIDVENGLGTEVLYQYSLIEADSSEIDLEILEDWYFNYVLEDEYQWYVILYTDKDDSTGVFAFSGVCVYTDVVLEDDGDGVYMLGSETEDTKLYWPNEEEEILEEDEDYVPSLYEETEEEETDISETSEDITLGMSNALEQALNYLNYTAFSYTGLMDQLEYEGYSEEEAAYAVDNCGADWNEQALKKAESYLEYTAFSYTGLIDQLEYEGFTADEAAYGADNCGADWYEQAVLKAEDYLEYTSFSKSGLIDQLEYEGFTSDQAEYAAEQVGY